MASSNPIPRFIDECFNYVSDRYRGEAMIKQKRAVLVFESTANGYHHFRIRLLTGIDMLMHLKKESDNKYDKMQHKFVFPQRLFFLSWTRREKRKMDNVSGRY